MLETESSSDATRPTIAGGPRLLDQFLDAARRHGQSDEVAQKAADWCRRFILFHGKRHAKEMGLAEIGRFLQHVAALEKDALRALEVARNALEFLYAKVLHRLLGELPLPRPPRLLDQVKQAMRVKHYALRTLVEGADGAFALMARLLYGCGLRLMECCRLRVKDIDLARGQIMVRQGKGAKDRVGPGMLGPPRHVKFWNPRVLPISKSVAVMMLRKTMVVFTLPA